MIDTNTRGKRPYSNKHFDKARQSVENDLELVINALDKQELSVTDVSACE